MRLSTRWFKSWGSLKRNVKTYEFAISPYEQKHFANLLSKSLPNFSRRAFNKSWVVLPFVIGWYLWEWCEAQDHLGFYKDPEDFKDDE